MRGKARSFDSNSRFMSVLNVRMVELAAIFCTIYLARELAGFNYRTDLLVYLFLGAGFMNFAVAGLEASMVRGRHHDPSRMLTLLGIGLDMATVLVLIYLTGSAWSPFLFLVVLPLFFSCRLSPSMSTGLIVTLATVSVIGLVSLLELRGVLPHFSCYTGGIAAIMNPHYITGTVLALGGFMGLMTYLFNTYYGSFRIYLREAERKMNKSRRRILELTRLYDISLGINSVISLETLLKMVCKEVTLLLKRPWAAVILTANGKKPIKYVEIGLEDENAMVKEERIGREPFIREVTGLGEGTVTDPLNVYSGDSIPSALKNRGLESILPVPIISGGDSLGVLLVGEDTDSPFTDEDSKLITILSGQVASAIEKSRLYEVMNGRINRLEKKNENLEDSNKLKMGYISHLSHELKTPLTSIKAYVESLQEHAKGLSAEERNEFLEVISSETDRLIRMVNKVLDVSRIEFGQKTLKRKVFTLGELMKEVRSSMQPYLKEKSLHLEVDIPEGLPAVDGDEDLIKQVFINLIGNAVKYSRKGGRIIIEAAEEAVFVNVSVRDEGEGISEDELENIFKRFYQVGRGLNDGVGLGLAIVKNIIEQHGGYIKVHSKLGEGTEFKFTLPKEHHFNNLLGFLFESMEARDEINHMFNLAVRVVAQVLSAKLVSIMILDQERKELFIKEAYGLDEEVVNNTRVKIGSSIAGKVAESGKPLLIENIEEIGITSSGNRPQYETKSLISVPIMIGSTVLGVINVNNKISGESFNEDDLALLKSLSMRVSKVIERMRMSEDFGAFLKETINSLRSLLEIYERDDAGLRRRVVDWSVKVCDKLGLGRKEKQVVQFVASVHDVGMTCVSEDILKKTLQLTSEEIDEIRSHPQRGAALIRPFEFVEMVSKIMLFHHEHIDGTGYPMGLKGDQIPMGSRILSVLDAYVSMISDRPYRKSRSSPEAVEELINNSTAQFDPSVVGAFIDVLVDDGDIEVEDYMSMVERLRAKSGKRILH